MRQIALNQIYRTIDANFNRAKEALRVCEDVARFILNHKKSAGEYKRLRHQLSSAVLSLKLSRLLNARDVQKDVGRKTTSTELKRNKIADIFYANSQRGKESIRVLEEFSKLLNAQVALEFKRMRYQLYVLEQKVSRQL